MTGPQSDETPGLGVLSDDYASLRSDLDRSLRLSRGLSAASTPPAEVPSTTGEGQDPDLFTAHALPPVMPLRPTETVPLWRDLAAEGWTALTTSRSPDSALEHASKAVAVALLVLPLFIVTGWPGPDWAWGLYLAALSAVTGIFAGLLVTSSQRRRNAVDRAAASGAFPHTEPGGAHGRA